MVDADRLSAAYETARCDLLSECETSGHWLGQLSGSALATATAVSALRLVERPGASVASNRGVDTRREGQLGQVMLTGLRWLASHQNSDGGWGDADRDPSNISATMLVRAAFHLTAVPANPPGMMERAEAFVATNGGIAGVKRRGMDKVFNASVLTNCALAGLIPWRCVPSLPFEWTRVAPERWKHLPGLPAGWLLGGCESPALMAVGQARFAHRKTWNLVARIFRARYMERGLESIARHQSSSGSFLHSVPMTSFVVMSLASAGVADHAIVRRGVEFLLTTVRPDGSWPIGSDRAVDNTSLAVNALATAGEDLRDLNCLDWLIACQYRQSDSVRGVEPGGWSWSGRGGGVPNVADTSAVLMALAAWPKDDPRFAGDRVRQAVLVGVDWLLKVQNTDGGWPTCRRGWGNLQLDRSGSDLTAQAMRALYAWRREIGAATWEGLSSWKSRLTAAIEDGLRYLARTQLGDGSWEPLWRCDPLDPRKPNRCAGTVAVLAAYRDFGLLTNPVARRGLDFLASLQEPDGGFARSVEETALAVELLLSAGRSADDEIAAHRGLSWLMDAVEANRYQECSPLGLDLGRLSYRERLNPIALTVAALGRASQRLGPRTMPRLTAHLENV